MFLLIVKVPVFWQILQKTYNVNQNSQKLVAESNLPGCLQIIKKSGIDIFCLLFFEMHLIMQLKLFSECLCRTNLLGLANLPQEYCLENYQTCFYSKNQFS